MFNFLPFYLGTLRKLAMFCPLVSNGYNPPRVVLDTISQWVKMILVFILYEFQGHSTACTIGIDIQNYV